VKVGIIHVWAALPSEKREASSSSQQGDVVGCPTSPYCKFEINLRLYAIWLVAMKYVMPIKTRNSEFGLPWHQKREKPALPHNMVIQMDIHSVSVVSLKLIQGCMLSG